MQNRISVAGLHLDGQKHYWVKIGNVSIDADFDMVEPEIEVEESKQPLVNQAQ